VPIQIGPESGGGTSGESEHIFVGTDEVFGDCRAAGPASNSRRPMVTVII